MVAVTAVILFFSFTIASAQPVDPLQQTEKEIMGYADRISVSAGDQVQFMLTASSSYDAQLVRLIHGDESPEGPGYKEEELPADLNGTHSGGVQTWDAGSYVEVPDRPELDLTGSFTVQAWVYPTTPERGMQGLVTKWSDDRGYGLFIDENGGLALRIGDRNGNVRAVRTGEPFHAPEDIHGGYHESNWYFVAASYDAETGEVHLYQEPVTEWPVGKPGVQQSGTIATDGPAVHEAPLIIAGYSETFDGERLIAGNFNGKIDSPRIFDRVLTEGEVRALKNGASALQTEYEPVAVWDFSREIQSTRVIDASENKLDGTIVNAPMRGMTGYNWTGDVTNYVYAPDEYGAIYFHDDDLSDAGWDPSLEYTVDDGLPSGYYAVRVRTENKEDYVPFFVHPAPEEEKGDIAFLAPTFTYLAYANIGNACPACGDISAKGTYSSHTDGTGVAHSTYLQPILDMRPKEVTHWGAGGSTPRHFAGDLYMIDWLEEKTFDYEVITDHDLHRDGKAAIDDYNVVITGSHPEYISDTMWKSLRSYLEGGGRVMYMGGNGFYWVTGVPYDKPHLIEVRRWGGTQGWEIAPGQYHQISDGKLGGLWRNRGRSPQKLVGAGFTAQGFDRNAVYAVEEGSEDSRAEFIYDGISEIDSIGAFNSLGMGYGTAGDEIDRLDYRLGSPPHTLLLGRATDFSDAYQLVVEDVMQMGTGYGGTEHPRVRSDIVFFEYPNDGAVWSVSSISWMEDLSYDDYSNPVSRMTENVLKAFAEDGPLPGR
jgi:N,N-dimethylformamidase